MRKTDWEKSTIIKAGEHYWDKDDAPDPKQHRDKVEPWLSALLQADHLALLVGNGLTTGLALAGGARPVPMDRPAFATLPFEKAVHEAAIEGGTRTGRSRPNIEDEIRAARQLLDGLDVLVRVPDLEFVAPCPDPSPDPQPGTKPKPASHTATAVHEAWRSRLDAVLKDFRSAVLETEGDISSVARGAGGQAADLAKASLVRRLLGSFLLTFASRAASRERLHVFTTNYDRLIEYGAELLGLRILDRFVGTLSPVFRASRLGVDLHYNPPGIRSEPRFLEGVVRLTKLHGSIDWYYEGGPAESREVRREPVPFGASGGQCGLPAGAEGLMIYPNPAKDVETLEYPYAELFRDFAGAVCQPNAVLVTYGYGFGDDHVNRVIKGMLTIPSTHLVIISFDGAGGRIARFCNAIARDEQISALIGRKVGGLQELVDHYLPTPAIDRNTWRMMDLLARRQTPRAGPHGGNDNLASGVDPSPDPDKIGAGT